MTKKSNNSRYLPRPLRHSPLVTDLFAVHFLSKCPALRKRSSFFDSKVEFRVEIRGGSIASVVFLRTFSSRAE